MRNCLFRFKAKFHETPSLFRETRNLFRFVLREIRNETSFAGNPTVVEAFIFKFYTNVLRKVKYVVKITDMAFS
jgi:hypothetical protein